MKNFILSISLLLLLAKTATAQRNIATQNNAWLVYLGNYKYASTWGIHVEAQVRRNNFFSHWQQLLLRTGIVHNITKNSSWALGYCFANTYPYGSMPAKTTFAEHRIWQQLLTSTNIGKIEMQSRFRLEQRFINLPNFKNNSWVADSLVYQNRFRLLSKFSVPLNKLASKKGGLYASMSEELFVSFGKQVGKNIFDQNRLSFVLGYQLSTNSKIEAGYLNQNIIKANAVDVENNHTILLSFICNTSFKK